jgi:thioredoxin 1
MKKVLLVMSMILAFAFNSEAQKVKEIDYATFSKEILPKAENPIVIDFYATWCGPCQAMEAVMNKAAKEYVGQIDFYRVDVDKNPEWANYLGISSIPTVLFYKDGKIHHVETGYKEYIDFVKHLSSITK